MRRALAMLTMLVVATTMVVAGSTPASADADDRAAAAILDAVPLPAEATPVDLNDRSRTYRIPVDAVVVLAHFRDQLDAAGWQEKATSRIPANNESLGSDGGGATDGGAETSGAGTGGSSSRTITGPIRVRWTMGGARLHLKITSAAVADQQTQGENQDESTFVLRARPSR